MKRKINKKRIIITSIFTAALASTIFSGYKITPKAFEGRLKNIGIEVSDDAIYGGLDDEGFMKEFSIVSCGNYTNKLGSKQIELLEDTTKPTGIMIESTARNYAAIYKDLDYAKNLVETYFVEYPICLNINGMFCTNSISEEEAYYLVKAFLEKAHANGLTVYVIGNEYSMGTLQSIKTILEENGQVDKYEFYKGLIMDSNTKKVLTNYDLVIGDKYIYSSIDYRNKKEGLLNSEKTFIEDFKYTVKDGESPEEVGSQFGLTGSDILRYNNIDEFKENQKIIIPSRSHEKNLLGVDISSYQQEINFETLKNAGVSFVLTRVGYTSLDYIKNDNKTSLALDNSYAKADTYFNHYSVELDKLDIKQGVYFYTGAKSFDDMDKEVDLLLRQLEGHNISLPVYIDIEEEKIKRLDDPSTRKLELDLIDYFCQRVEEAGYTPGIYINKSHINYIAEYAGTYPIWASGGYFYNVEQSLNDMYITTYLEDGVTIFQNTKKGYGAELGAESQYICLDYAESSFIKTKKMN